MYQEVELYFDEDPEQDGACTAATRISPAATRIRKTRASSSS